MRLDNPVWTALNGPHAFLAERSGRAVRYPVDVSPFAGLPDEPDDAAWADLAELVGPGGRVLLGRATLPPVPAPWRIERELPGVQMVLAPGAGESTVDPSAGAQPEPVCGVGEHPPASTAGAQPEPVCGVGEHPPASTAELRTLTAADVPEMLDLVERTQPGPFAPRTIELGHYIGVRRDGVLAAMAGERLRLPGFTEVSAVCTDPRYRGQGLAGRLTRAVMAGIVARGETPILHAAADNVSAIRLYETLGYQLRRKMAFAALSPA